VSNEFYLEHILSVISTKLLMGHFFLCRHASLLCVMHHHLISLHKYPVSFHPIDVTPVCVYIERQQGTNNVSLIPVLIYCTLPFQAIDEEHIIDLYRTYYEIY
jgi:hypothetical protein